MDLGKHCSAQTRALYSCHSGGFKVRSAVPTAKVLFSGSMWIVSFKKQLHNFSITNPKIKEPIPLSPALSDLLLIQETASAHTSFSAHIRRSKHLRSGSLMDWCWLFLTHTRLAEWITEKRDPSISPRDFSLLVDQLPQPVGPRLVLTTGSSP